MVVVDDDGDDVVVKRKIQEMVVESACQEYSDNVKRTLNSVNRRLDQALARNYAELEELEEKIAARTGYLEKNPTFLTSITYNADNIKIDSIITELDEIRITLKEHSRRMIEKIEQIESYHRKLFELVIDNSNEALSLRKMAEDMDVGLFQDCLQKEFEKMKEEEERLMKIVEEERVNANVNLTRTDPPIKEEAEEKPQGTEEKKVCPDDEVKEEPPEPAKEEPPAHSEGSFHHVTIEKNAFSDTFLNNQQVRSQLSTALFPAVAPDVYRKRPFEDLHGRLLQQLEASDSLHGFIKMMERKPSEKKSQDLQEKYSGSLWFFGGKTAKNKTKKPSPSQKKSSSGGCKKETNKPEMRSSTVVSGSGRLAMVASGTSAFSDQDRMKKSRDNNSERTKLKCYDLLDDLAGKDLKPIKSEYPRRDDVFFGDEAGKGVEKNKSYLHRMMDEEETVWKELLRPPPQQQKKKKKRAALTPSEPKMIKRTSSTKKSQDTKSVKSLMEYLTAPQRRLLNDRPRTLIVMPVKVMYDNFPTKELSSPKRSSVDRKKEMMEQVRNLKMHSNKVQVHVQKAIDVIETKMIDLLSNNNNNNNSNEAFNVMEREISNVLKMINEGEGDNKNTEKKMEAEKDVDSHEKSKSPKLKRGVTMVRKTEEAQKKQVDEEKTRRAANIEEGERLLGQVDDVIKKIDSIYTKFYDENKIKRVGKEDSDVTFNFLDELKKSMPTKLCYKAYVEEVAMRFKEARIYWQSKLYHQPVIKMVGKVAKLNEDEERKMKREAEKKKKEGEGSKKEEERVKREEERRKKKEEIRKTEEELYKVAEDIKRKQKEEEEERTKAERQRKVEQLFEDAKMDIIECEKTIFATSDDRHESILKAFYALFFSSVFLAVNFDYVA